MRIVLLTSPGAAPILHWSFSLGEALHRALQGAGHGVHWLASVAEGAMVPPDTAAEVLRTVVPPRHKVAASILHDDLERALAAELRERPADVVLQVGLGALGSANLLWLADRMGSRAMAVVRAAEVVCHRGDWIDERGQACAVVDDPGRCSACCSKGLRRAVVADLASRLDLLVCCLQVSGAVFVASQDEAELLEQVGVPRRLHRVMAPERFVDAVLAELAPANRHSEMR